MTHLNIQQGLNIEVVSTNLIKKLYEAALSVPEPLEGELDAAYMSGNLLVNKAYRSLVEYLTNRFDDLHINVTAGYYIPFHDSAVNDVLKNTIGDGIGVTLEQLKAANPNNTVGPSNNTSIVDTREMCLMEGTVSGNTFFADCTNLKIIGIPLNLTRISEGIYKGVSPEKVVVKNLINFLNAIKVLSFNRDQGWDLYLTNDGTNIEKIENLIIPDGVTFLNSVQQSPFYGCTSIKNVTVPSGLTALGGVYNSSIESLTFEANSTLLNIWDNCFYQCSNFVFDVTNLPQTITTIGSNAFRSCSNVTGTLNLPNLTSLGSNAFNNTRITSILSLGTITELPSLCFYGCNISSMNQSTIDLITSWGWLSLPVSGSLATNIKPGPNTKRLLPSIIGVNNPNGVVYLPLITRSLQNNNNLVDGDCHCPFNYRYNSGVVRNIYGLIYMPNLSLIEGGYGTFPYQNGLAIDTTADLFYIKSVSTLTPGTFSECNISHIIINNTTPPNLVDTQGLQNETGGLKKCIFSYNGSLSGIYVPDSAVNSYKTAWGDVLAVTPVNNNGAYLSENVIKPISSLNGGIIYATENDWISDGRPSALIAEYMGLNTADLATFVSANNLTYYTPPSS